jgi:8-oxo-dGTP pyrophosphatase MutT (NUDIX family)
MTLDPRLVALRHTLARRSALALEREAGEREAAVALVVRPRGELELLLIERAVRPSDPWSGHMALPGGRRSAEDADLLATALRETEEETGVPRNASLLIGSLDEVAPRSRRLPPLVIAPYVVAVEPGTRAMADAREVAATLWIPLSALRHEGAVSSIVIGAEEDGAVREFPTLVYREHVIWGLTHRILTQFLEVAALAGV